MNKIYNCQCKICGKEMILASNITTKILRLKEGGYTCVQCNKRSLVKLKSISGGLSITPLREAEKIITG